MSSTFISRYTPSMMEPETLEALFVQREKLADQVMDDIRHSATTKAKHYNLLIASRGLGKTHFVSLIHNRVLADAELSDKLRIAWLREEERGVASFLELLMRILMSLERKYNNKLSERMQHLYELPRDKAERAAAELLTEYLGDRTLLLLVENLDAIFDGIKASGQKAFRSYLQEHANCAILATAPVLFSGVSLRTSPFYGFFNVHHIGELANVDEVVDLLARIATVRGDEKLADFIRTPTGRSRIRAVHHLAGGNYRIYVIFSEFLTPASLDQLVDPFMRMLDDLTPYYQSKLDMLSPQQQQIIEFLTHTAGARTVKEIARRCFMSQQAAATQLKSLKEIGYLRANTSKRDKRETYYELREPLMRLSFEVKEYRGGPIRLFVDFLRFWYSSDELLCRLKLLSEDSEFERLCVEEALKLKESETDDPRVRACEEEFYDYAYNGEWERAYKTIEELVCIRGVKTDLFDMGRCLDKLGRYEEALAAFDDAIELYEEELSGFVRYAKIQTLLSLGRNDEARKELEQIKDFPNLLQASCYSLIGSIHRAKHQYGKALILFNKALSLKVRGSTWLEIGNCLAFLGRFDESLSAFNKAIEHLNNIEVDYFGHLLIETIPSLLMPSVTSKTRQHFIESLYEIINEVDAFQRPLAMLVAAVEYLNTGDDRPLLALPLEGRAILEMMLSKRQEDEVPPKK